MCGGGGDGTPICFQIYRIRVDRAQVGRLLNKPAAYVVIQLFFFFFPSHDSVHLHVFLLLFASQKLVNADRSFSHVIVEGEH